MRVMIKGAGDLATGVAHRLSKCGCEIVMTEIPQPTTIRRTVAFSSAIMEQTYTVEGVEAVYCQNKNEVEAVLSQKKIAVIIDPKGEAKSWYKPQVVIDAILAKSNKGTTIGDAPIVIALGPGFTAGQDCHCVVETMRGHYLGSCIYEGAAQKNTGVPGNIGGYTIERLIRSPKAGVWTNKCKIGDSVEAGEVVAYVDDLPVKVEIAGILRGLLADGLMVAEGMKVGDVDPRCALDHCFTISDKARSIGGAVLEGMVHLARRDTNHE